jgi:leucyl-tRNA---protein transferase
MSKRVTLDGQGRVGSLAASETCGYDGCEHQQSTTTYHRSSIMESLFTFATVPSSCGYLPEQEWSLSYEVVGQITPREYMERLKSGWRRFGFSLFKPECPSCTSCRSLRVPVKTFKPDRSQRRATAANKTDITLAIGLPAVSETKLELYDRFHRFQHDNKGWPQHGEENPGAYIESFIDNPFPTEEWCYFRGSKLLGVGYVDRLPEGLSAIYFFYDPDERERSLGTYNVVSIIREAANRHLPHVYLGYYVEGCRSLEYKGRFRPNEIVYPNGEWRLFRE